MRRPDTRDLSEHVAPCSSATVGAGCAYRVTVRLTRLAAGHRVVVKARFLTHGGMLARSAPSSTVTVRR